jgi:hypothetical protein
MCNDYKIDSCTRIYDADQQAFSFNASTRTACKATSLFLSMTPRQMLDEKTRGYLFLVQILSFQDHRLGNDCEKVPEI